MRVLLSEGNSTSAREAITALGLSGHSVEICDPEPFCLGRFSRFVARVHRCPGIGRDPAGYLAFICDLLERRRFDVLLPIHEQGLVFAKARGRLTKLTKLAIPSFDSYLTALDKAAFSALLLTLGIAQPQTTILPSPAALPARVPMPCVLKASIATASRGTFVIRSDAELAAARAALARDGGRLLLQQWLDGPTESQALFEHGRLRGIAAFRRLMARGGAGRRSRNGLRRTWWSALSARRGAARLARRHVLRLYPAWRHRAFRRLQSAAGRADALPLCRCRPCRAASRSPAATPGRG